MRWTVLLMLAACAKGGTGDAPDAMDVPHDAPPKFDGPPIDQAVDMCASAATCQAAMSLGTVSGDTGNAKLSAMGYQSAWFRVRVTEDDSSTFPGLTLRVGAKLTSPSSADYDVFVYVNVGADQVECSTTLGTTTTAGTVNDDKAEWGEGTVPNGFDDSRDVSIEVRPISGQCAPGAPWTLEIEGNWL